MAVPDASCAVVYAAATVVSSLTVTRDGVVVPSSATSTR